MVFTLLVGLSIGGTLEAQEARPSAAAGPVIVVETSKGAFEFETYPTEAPKTVAHIINLVKRNFYNGQRVHRVVPGFVIQFGDPQSRDVTKRGQWGKGSAASSGHPIGVAEISKKRTHKKGAVAMAHAGDPAQADSQIYVTLAAHPELNGKYTVFGQVIAGADVPGKLEVGDVIQRMYVK
jgi:cyclophilin family peptidyl-prolyl cis-trans isomerase